MRINTRNWAFNDNADILWCLTNATQKANVAVDEKSSMFSSSIEILQKGINKQQPTTWKSVFDMRWLLTGCSSFLLFLEPLLMQRHRSQVKLRKKRKRKLSQCQKAGPGEYKRFVKVQPQCQLDPSDDFWLLSTTPLTCRWINRTLRTYVDTER